MQLHFNRDGHSPRDARFMPLAQVNPDLSQEAAEDQLKTLETMWFPDLEQCNP